MTTTNTTTTTPTARKRWTMFHRAMRVAEAERAKYNIKRSTFERLAAQWAGPYLGRFAQLSTSTH